MKLTIEKEVYGGDGLARLQSGRSVFVPYVLPGEVVEAEFEDGRDAAAKPRLLRLNETSPHRVSPECRHFGRCGGCQYQHASYDLQLSIKLEILMETLKRAGVYNHPTVTMHSGEPWGYRNRIRLHVARDVSGEAIQFGYNIRETRDFLPIEECPIASPLLWRAASALLKLSGADPICFRWLSDTRELEMFTTGEERSLQITFFLHRERSAGFSGLCEKIKAAIPEFTGAGVAVVSEEGTRSRTGTSWGRPGLQYPAADRSYWVSRGGFFQVNRFLVDDLVRVVTTGRHGLLAWDLFAGVGLFSRVLADRFERVIAVEANATAARDMAAAKVNNLRGIAMPAVDFLRGAVLERDRPDLVVMDPPRAGVGTEVCGLLARMQVPQIVYVSCDPSTLARDLRLMVDSGYDLAELHLVDLFPQTFHLETVAVLDRSAR